MEIVVALVLLCVVLIAVAFFGGARPQERFKLGTKKRRIAVIEVGTFVPQIFGLFFMPRLGTILLATILRERGRDAKAFVERPGWPLDWSWILSADAVCISITTETSLRGYEMAARLRQRGITVIMGGVHATALPEEALKHCSYVVRQEGDETLPHLLQAIFFEGVDIQEVRGVSYRVGSRINHNESRPFIKDLDAFPSPDFNLLNGFKPKFGRLWLRLKVLKALGLYFLPFSGSRGCSSGCNFCSIKIVFGRDYRTKSPKRVVEELKEIVQYTPNIFWVDDNATQDRERLKEICRLIIEDGLAIKFTLQMRAEDALNDPELIELLSRAGCVRVYVGFESADNKTLKAMGKGQKAEDMKQAVATLHRFGIKVHGMFIVGFDTDDRSSFGKTLQFAREIGVDTAQFLALSILPGSKLYTDMLTKGRLIEGVSWHEVDGFNVTFRPAQMEPHELQFGILKLHLDFYNFKHFLQSIKREGFFFSAVLHIYVRVAAARVRKNSSAYLRKHGLRPQARM